MDDFESLYQRAQFGDVNAQMMLGRMFLENKIWILSAYWYGRAANQHHSLAQNILGWHYQYGRGVPQSHDEAIKWYRLAAQQGDCIAQCRLELLLAT